MLNVVSFMQNFVTKYEAVVQGKYPDKLRIWPCVNGFNFENFSTEEYNFYILRSTGNSMLMSFGNDFRPCSDFGVSEINDRNILIVKKTILELYRKHKHDVVVAFKRDSELKDDEYQKELLYCLMEHELTMGVAKMKIFLSHKGKDKTLVRGFNTILKTLGFETWLDEDNLPAGSRRDRDFEKAIKECCAVVFFITENFHDEKFLKDEIDFSLNEKREREDMFSIIALSFNNSPVPDVLHRFIYKEPNSELEALKEIIVALPLQLGRPEYK